MEASTTIKGMTQGNQIFVPNYQRAYSWEVGKSPSEKKQVDTFLADLEDYLSSMTTAKESKDFSPYYFGHFLYENTGDGEYAIIDGQQRLTTITIFVSALFSLIEEERSLTGGEEDYKRAKFVLGEKDRVLAVCDALNEGDYEKVGEMMYQTHEGLSKDYEVSCEELDFLNEIAKENGVTGSRIMGGGFGGCTINLVRNDLYRQFIADAKKRFNEKYGHEPKVYDVVIGDGSRKLC